MLVFTADGKQSAVYGGNSNALGTTDEYDDEEYDQEEYYDDNDGQKQNQHQQQHLQHQQHQQQHKSFSSASGSSSSGASHGFQHYPRNRRELPDFNDMELQNRLSCNRSHCAVIKCTTKQLENGGSAWIALRMRLVTGTLNLVREFLLFSNPLILMVEFIFKKIVITRNRLLQMFH